MVKVSLIVALTSIAALAVPKNVLCAKYYSENSNFVEKLVRKQEHEANRQARLFKKVNPRLVNELYEPMFVKQFESEFSIILNKDYREMFKRLLFDPASLTKTDWDLLRSGFPHDTKISEENANGSLLKSYLNLNHLTIDRQEHEAEAILSKLRGKDVQLTQIEKVALRVARVIGRDYDFFEGTTREIKEDQIKRMKARFLSIFSFAGKTLSDAELDALYASYVTTDNPVSTYRYDISQVYDFKYKNLQGKDSLYITNEMIAARNQRVLEKAERYKNPVLTAEINKKLENPKLKAALDGLNAKLDTDAGLAESLRFVRLTISGQTGKQNPFKNSEELGRFVEAQTKYFEDALASLEKPGIKAKVKILMEGMTEHTLHADHVAALKARLDMSKPESKKLIEFIESDIGVRLFGVVRTEYRRMEENFLGEKSLGLSDLKDIFKRNLGLLEETAALKRTRPDLFEAVYQFKLVRTGLTLTEVTEIFKIAQRNPAMRLLSLASFDPLARYGFCFGRAYWFQRMLLAHGVHPDSIGKVLVDGKMSGGLTGWAWHIAPTVEREGGGLWVLDQSHGEPQTITKWFNHYRDHMDADGEIQQGASKDDRIKIFFTPGDRFGRSFWGGQDFKVMESQYESIWNKFGADIKYFRDVGENLEANGFNDDAAGALRNLSNGLLDALKIGF